MAIALPLSQGYTAWIDDEDAHLAKHKWSARVSGRTVYAHRGIWDGAKVRPVQLHRVVLGIEDPKVYVDHLDGDGLNCRRANLSAGTGQANKRNVPGPNRNSKSGYLGVTQRSPNCWLATITDCGRKIRLGCYPTAAQANLARLHAEEAMWGVLPQRRAAFEEAGLC